MNLFLLGLIVGIWLGAFTYKAGYEWERRKEAKP